MTPILNIIPVNFQEKERSVDMLSPGGGWEQKERPASLIILDTQIKDEADDFIIELKGILDPIADALHCDFGIRPPVKSLAYGDHFVIRVDGTDRLQSLVQDHESKRNNPPHARKRKSFSQLLNESFEARHSFSTFMDQVLQEWRGPDIPMTPHAFCDWITSKNRETNRDFPILHITLMERIRNIPPSAPDSATNRSQFGLSSNAMDGIVGALISSPLVFSPDAPAHLRFRPHVLMGRILGCRPIVPANTQKLIDEAFRTKDHGPLFMTLFGDSGIYIPKLSEFSGLSEAVLERLRYGNHLRYNHDKAAQITGLLNPPILDTTGNLEIAAQNSQLEEMIVSRPLTLSYKEILEDARKALNPSLVLLNMMIGARGKVDLNNDQLAAILNEKLKAFNPSYTGSQIRNRRIGVARIIEREAIAFAEIGNCPKNQMDEVVEVLTGIPGPHKLLDAVEAEDPKLKISINDATRQMRERKGLTTYQMGVAQIYISRFETTPGFTIQPKAGRRVAAALELQGDERRRYIMHAMGKSVLDAEQIMQQAAGDPHMRADALRTLTQWIGSPRSFATSIGSKPATVERWIKNGGIIAHRDPARVINAFAERVIVDQPKDGPTREKFSAAFRQAFMPYLRGAAFHA